MKLTGKTSDTLYVIRAFAILSVITAHMPFGSGYPVAESLRTALSQVGVIVFFILSGIFYKREKGDTLRFWKKKTAGIIIPWLLFAVITFAVSVLLTKDYSSLVLRCVRWVFGIGTWYWYVPVLLIFYAVFKFIKKDYALYVCIVLTVVSNILSVFEIIPYNGYFNQYLNVFNWIGFFAIGLLIKKHNLTEKLMQPKAVIPSAAVFALFCWLSVFLGVTKAYINYCSVITELSGFVTLMGVSCVLRKSKLLADIGKKSYLIYLINVQPAGIVNTRLPYNTLFFILRPFTVLAAIYIAVKLVELIINKTPLKKHAEMLALR